MTEIEIELTIEVSKLRTMVAQLESIIQVKQNLLENIQIQYVLEKTINKK